MPNLPSREQAISDQKRILDTAFQRGASLQPGQSTELGEEYRTNQLALGHSEDVIGNQVLANIGKGVKIYTREALKGYNVKPAGIPVPVGTGTAYIPEGSAAAANIPNLGKSNVPISGGESPGLPPTGPQIDTGQPSPEKVQAQPFTGRGGVMTRYKAPTPVVPPPPPPKSKLEEGFEQAGAAGEQTPDGAVGAAGLMKKYAPSDALGVGGEFVQSDPYLGELMQSVREFLKPESQGNTLVQNYKALSEELGLGAINEKMISLENIMRGTEDQLAQEITKSGGFATSGQIRALANSRNKTFLEEYSTLQRTLESKEKYLSTIIGLEERDRQSASDRFNQAFSMMFNVAEYQQRAQQYAQESYRWTISKIGFDGLYNSTNGDPYYVDLVEQSLGLPQGGLQSAAQKATQARAQEQAMGELDLTLKQAQIATEEARREKIHSELSTPGTRGTDVDPVTGQRTVSPIAENSLTDLLLQYRSEIESSTKVGRFFRPTTQSRIDSLRGQITAIYKQEQKLGTLDAGVQKLIESIVGRGPGSKIDPRSYAGLVLPSKQSEKSILAAVDSFLTNQSGIDLTKKNELRKQVPRGQIMVINRETRQIGSIPPEEFDSGVYIKI